MVPEVTWEAAQRAILVFVRSQQQLGQSCPSHCHKNHSSCCYNCQPCSHFLSQEVTGKHTQSQAQLEPAFIWGSGLVPPKIPTLSDHWGFKVASLSTVRLLSWATFPVNMHMIGLLSCHLMYTYLDISPTEPSRSV